MPSERVDISLDVSGMAEAERLLRNLPEVSREVVRTVIRRMPGVVRPTLLKETVSRYAIERGRVEETLGVYRSPEGLRAAVTSKGRPRALSYFETDPSVDSGPPFRHPAGGVFARVKKGGGKRIPHAFLARMRSGHVGVFLRKEKSPLPVEQKIGPSVPQMAGNPEVVEAIQDRVERILDRDLLRMVQAALR